MVRFRSSQCVCLGESLRSWLLMTAFVCACGPAKQETARPDDRAAEQDESLAGTKFDGKGGASGSKRVIKPGDEELAKIEDLIAKGQFKDAQVQAQTWAQTKPSDANAHYALGLASSRLGDDAGAMKAYDQALRVDPQHAYAKIAKARYFAFAQGNLVAARDLAAQVVARTPDFAEAQLVLGTIELDLGEPEKALEALEKARAKEPGHPDVHFHLARAYGALGRFAEASASCDRAIAIEPGVSGVDVRMLRARLIGQTGDQEATLRAFEEALRVAPDRLDLRLEAVRGLLRLGWLSQAQAMLAPALANAPQDPTVLLTHGRLLAAENKLDGNDGALAKFAAAAQADAQSPAPDYYRVDALVRAHRCVEAKKSAAQFSQRFGSSPEVAKARDLANACR
jgi:tetratricopeptide (TPR) repeat protein